MGKKYFGVALDMCRNAVMKVEEVKKYVDIISSFGYNLLQIYIEDTFEVDNEPFFGYMRGRYSKKELKEISDYCVEKGIEFVPNIQTLAHIRQIFRWPDYAEIRDFGDIMLAEEERTYQLIENMFKTLKENTSARMVNIGMDEAHMLGLGEYLDRHGYQNRFDILNRHLLKVMSICEKYGFEPVMWSDMFFRLANNGAYYAKDAQSITVTQEIKDCVPKGVSLCYWDYYHQDINFYRTMMKAHLELDPTAWFAGCAWTFDGFAPMNKWSLKTMIPAMQTAKETGLNKIVITTWGDDGAECSRYGVLPSLFYIKKIYDGETDEQKIKDEFKKIVGVDFDLFMKLDIPNDICGGQTASQNPCKYTLYSDIFSGYLDVTLPDGGAEDFAKNRDILIEAKENAGEYSHLFDTLAKLCDVLSIKYDLGIKLRKAYKAGDKAELKELAGKIGLTADKVREFYKALRYQWFKENKTYGFEVQDIRLGGLETRLRSCKEMLEDYLSGKTQSILELEEELLPLTQNGERILLEKNLWEKDVSVNVICDQQI